jgi:hypothetical protein
MFSRSHAFTSGGLSVLYTWFTPGSLLELTKLIQILLKGEGFDVNLQELPLPSLLSLPILAPFVPPPRHSLHDPGWL